MTWVIAALFSAENESAQRGDRTRFAVVAGTCLWITSHEDYASRRGLLFVKPSVRAPIQS